MSFGAELGARQRARFGIYVHVPFCAHVCPYCDFVKTARFGREDVEAFFSHLERSLEAALVAVPSQWPKVCTLYFGGGTPGMFPASRIAPLIARVRQHFEIEECTVECNPATRKAFEELRGAGVNRVTLGVQSLDARVLEALGRRHSPALALRAVEAARAAGLEQVQADLIFGLKPGLRGERIEDEVASLEAAGATGISAYALTLEPRTRLWGSGLADDESAVTEYPRLRAACERFGFVRRETANFSRFEARHNNIYWFGWPYLGLGTGAHGLSFPTERDPWGRRFRVGQQPREQEPGNDLLPFATHAEELFALEWESSRARSDVLTETVFTLLRTPDGLTWEWLASLFPEKPEFEIRRSMEKDSKLARAVNEGRMSLDTVGMRLEGDEFLLGDGWSTHVLSILEAGLGH